jgi:hypothetical protein
VVQRWGGSLIVGYSWWDIGLRVILYQVGVIYWNFVFDNLQSPDCPGNGTSESSRVVRTPDGETWSIFNGTMGSDFGS